MNRSIPEVQPEPSTLLVAGALPILVVAYGPGWLVVEKPCGMSIHNEPGDDLCTLVLAALRAGPLPVASHDFSALHAAHRIDRDTSGIVLLAGDSRTLACFGGQFAAHTVHKRYLALVHGHIEAMADGPVQGEWTWPLTAVAAGRNDPMGKGKRIPCITSWRILTHSLHYSLVECEPLTGRKHQIRRHAKLAGHPVVGDRRYGSERSRAFLRRHHNFHRLGLHAHTLTIRLPGDKEATTFQSSGLPAAMQQLLEMDR